jgi:hypothetical protein
MISIVPLLTDLKLRFMHSFKVMSVRHSTFEPEGVAARTLTIKLAQTAVLVIDMQNNFGAKGGMGIAKLTDVEARTDRLRMMTIPYAARCTQVFCCQIRKAFARARR